MTRVRGTVNPLVVGSSPTRGATSLQFSLIGYLVPSIRICSHRLAVDPARDTPGRSLDFLSEWSEVSGVMAHWPWSQTRTVAYGGALDCRLPSGASVVDTERLHGARVACARSNSEGGRILGAPRGERRAVAIFQSCASWSCRNGVVSDVTAAGSSIIGQCPRPGRWCTSALGKIVAWTSAKRAGT
jgi:hypothetical protein